MEPKEALLDAEKFARTHLRELCRELRARSNGANLGTESRFRQLVAICRFITPDNPGMMAETIVTREAVALVASV